MAYLGETRGEYVTAHAQITHGQIAADGGYVGTAIKQVTPPADSPRTFRNIILQGEKYFLAVEGQMEAPLIAGVTQGELIYVDTTANTLGTASGTGKQVLGRVSDLPGVHGCPTGIMRINTGQKV